MEIFLLCCVFHFLKIPVFKFLKLLSLFFSLWSFNLLFHLSLFIIYVHQMVVEKSLKYLFYILQIFWLFHIFLGIFVFSDFIHLMMITSCASCTILLPKKQLSEVMFSVMFVEPNRSSVQYFLVFAFKENQQTQSYLILFHIVYPIL